MTNQIEPKSYLCFVYMFSRYFAPSYSPSPFRIYYEQGATKKLRLFTFFTAHAHAVDAAQVWVSLTPCTQKIVFIDKNLVRFAEFLHASSYAMPLYVCLECARRCTSSLQDTCNAALLFLGRAAVAALWLTFNFHSPFFAQLFYLRVCMLYAVLYICGDCTTRHHSVYCRYSLPMRHCSVC